MSTALIPQTTSTGLAKTVSEKSGAVRFSFITRKAWGVANNLKGAALKRAHDAYRMDFSSKMGGDVCKAISEGIIHVTALGHNKKDASGSIRFVRDLKAVRTSREKELLDIITKLESQLANLGSTSAPATA